MITNVDSMNDSDPVNPINLRERFECRYKINHDPAYYSEYGRRARVDDPWLQIIPCHHGEIFPWGGTCSQPVLPAGEQSPTACLNSIAAR